MASAKATIDHDEIRKWVEDRGGFPAHVKRTGEDDDPGVLRIDNPGYSGTDTLERISWDDWFNWFDRDKLAFLYQAEGESRFSKLVARDSVDVSARSSKRSSSGSRSRKASQPSVGERLTHAVKDVVAAVEQVVTQRGSSKKSSSRKAGGRKASRSRKASPSRKSSSRKSSSRKSASRKSASRKSASRKGSSKKRSSKKR